MEKEYYLKEFQKMLDNVQTIIEKDKTILQNKKFIRFMKKFGYEYDGSKVNFVFDNQKINKMKEIKLTESEISSLIGAMYLTYKNQERWMGLKEKKKLMKDFDSILIKLDRPSIKKEETIQGVITKPIDESVEMIVSEEDMDIIKKYLLNK